MRANIAKVWSGLDDGQRALLVQLMRYGVVGVGVTAFQIAIYNLLVGAGQRPPLIANLIATGFAMLVGYSIHSRFTFERHDGRGNPAVEALRFVAANVAGLALNSLWVWLISQALGLSPHLASVPMFFVTPIALFWLNRVWVFG